MAATVTTIVEIAAPPALVRSLFLDFPSMSKWHAGHFKAINILESATAKPDTPSTTESIGEKLAVGDTLRIGVSGMSFKAKVEENTPHRFVWGGGLSLIMLGVHSFQFDESRITPGGTTLTHAETFSGGLVTLSKPFMKHDKDQKSPGFEKFNADLKAWAEKCHASGQ